MFPMKALIDNEIAITGYLHPRHVRMIAGTVLTNLWNNSMV